MMTRLLVLVGAVVSTVVLLSSRRRAAKQPPVSIEYESYEPIQTDLYVTTLGQT